MTTPTSYVCAKCKANKCKLWRDYSMSVTLWCAYCAIEREKKQGTVIQADGTRVIGANQTTDTIGWTVPAVPALDADNNYYAYLGNVPEARLEWWRNLPSYPETRPRADEGREWSHDPESDSMQEITSE